MVILFLVLLKDGTVRGLFGVGWLYTRATITRRDSLACSKSLECTFPVCCFCSFAMFGITENVL